MENVGTRLVGCLDEKKYRLNSTTEKALDKKDTLSDFHVVTERRTWLARRHKLLAHTYMHMASAFSQTLLVHLAKI